MSKIIVIFKQIIVVIFEQNHCKLWQNCYDKKAWKIILSHKLKTFLLNNQTAFCFVIIYYKIGDYYIIVVVPGYGLFVVYKTALDYCRRLQE